MKDKNTIIQSLQPERFVMPLARAARVVSWSQNFEQNDQEILLDLFGSGYAGLGKNGIYPSPNKKIRPTDPYSSFSSKIASPWFASWKISHICKDTRVKILLHWKVPLT